MPFIPHTEDDVRAMLATIGVPDIETLFDEIPVELRAKPLTQVPVGLNELDVTRLMQERAAQDGRLLNFIGAGAYEHSIPAAVWQMATRGEFYSAYTPYQAEASQGTLQLLYEFQSMICALTGMEVSNASLYDGASALAEAVLMAVRASNKTSRRVLIPKSVHPVYRRVVRAIVSGQNIEIVELPYDRAGGHTDPAGLDAVVSGDCVALVVPQPNFFGVVEEVDALTDWAHARGALVIAQVNPIALTVLKPPGEWGAQGADIACGEGQPLGIPLSGGGPYFGFMTCKKKYVRQMPGRIIGRTVDLDGKPGFTLTLQAREQHIRRAKATSNICTNQGLMVTAATIHMAILGAAGLRSVALASHAKTQELIARLAALPGVKRAFNRPVFHEAVLRFDLPLEDLLRPLHAHGILPGYAMGDDYPELRRCLLICVTETKTEADLARYTDHLGRLIQGQMKAASPAQPKMA